jgi:hypothetical protein
VPLIRSAGDRHAIREVGDIAVLHRDSEGGVGVDQSAEDDGQGDRFGSHSIEDRGDERGVVGRGGSRRNRPLKIDVVDQVPHGSLHEMPVRLAPAGRMTGRARGEPRPRGFRIRPRRPAGEGLEVDDVATDTRARV